jgi:hypothetical protein
MTAGSKGGGRASTPSMMHASEVAHFEDPEFLTGLLNALPMEPETIAVLESTANGFNDFHTIWDNAVRGRRTRRRGSCGCRCSTAGRTTRSTRCRSSATRRATGSSGRSAIRTAAATGGAVAAGGVRRDARAAQLAPADPARPGVPRQDRPVPSGAPGDAGAGVHRVGQPGVLRDPGVAGDQGGDEARRSPVQGVLRGAEWRERARGRGRSRCRSAALWVPAIRPRRSTVTCGASTSGCWCGSTRVNEETDAGRAREDERKPDGQYVVFADIALGQGATSGPATGTRCRCSTT